MTFDLENETVWSFRTARFVVRLDITPEHGYHYDGDDEDGTIQDRLDSGVYVAFSSAVIVTLDGVEIGRDDLGGSVYDAGDDSFWTGHRSPNPMHRNCSIMRAARGGNVAIGHYFPDMVKVAISMARKHLSRLPVMRAPS